MIFLSCGLWRLLNAHSTTLMENTIVSTQYFGLVNMKYWWHGIWQRKVWWHMRVKEWFGWNWHVKQMSFDTIQENYESSLIWIMVWTLFYHVHVHDSKVWTSNNVARNLGCISWQIPRWPKNFQINDSPDNHSPINFIHRIVQSESQWNITN